MVQMLYKVKYITFYMKSFMNESQNIEDTLFNLKNINYIKKTNNITQLYNSIKIKNLN